MAYFWAILIYLILLVAVGAYRSRAVKRREDFIVAGRQLSAKVLVGTLLATWIGSGKRGILNYPSPEWHACEAKKALMAEQSAPGEQKRLRQGKPPPLDGEAVGTKYPGKYPDASPVFFCSRYPYPALSEGRETPGLLQKPFPPVTETAG